MSEELRGRVAVVVSSAAVLHPPGPLNSAYGASKFALNQFTRHLAAELSGTGVTANVIHPGEVKTEMWESIQAGSEPTWLRRRRGFNQRRISLDQRRFAKTDSTLERCREVA